MKLSGEKNRRRIERVAEWLDLSAEDREPKTQIELAKELDTTEQTIIFIKHKIEKEKEEATGDEYTDYIDRLEKIMFTSRGTPGDRMLYARIKGWLAEKPSTKESIVTADDIARSEVEAERRDREFRTRMEGGEKEVSKELSLLSK